MVYVITHRSGKHRIVVIRKHGLAYYKTKTAAKRAIERKPSLENPRVVKWKFQRLFSK